MTREELSGLLDLSLLMVPVLVVVTWWFTLRVWQRRAPSTYWNVPLRTLHAGALFSAVVSAQLTVHTWLTVRLIYPNDAGYAAFAWGGLPLTLFGWSVLGAVGALVTAGYVWLWRPSPETSPRA